MSNTMRLSNYLFTWFMKGFGKALFLTTGFLGVLMLWLGTGSGGDMASYSIQPTMFYSYDVLVDNSLISTVFSLGHFLLLGGIFLQANGFYVNGKGAYTLFTLPMKRSQVFLAFFYSAMAIVFLYFTFWLILMVLGYFLITASQNQAAAEMVFRLSPTEVLTGIDASRTNGFFLAFQRSSFLSSNFPTSYIQVVTLCGGLFFALAMVVLAGLYHQNMVARVGLLFLGYGGLCIASYRLLYNVTSLISNTIPFSQQLPNGIFWGIGAGLAGLFGLYQGIRSIEKQKNI